MTFQMHIEFLVSTTNRSNPLFLERIFKNMEYDKVYYTCINQCYDIPPDNISISAENKTVYSESQKGLSKSRNLAIKRSKQEICVVADDDLVYLSDCVEKIIGEYEKDKELDVAIFQVITPEGGPYKNYKSNSFRLKKAWDQYRVSSVEITFRRERIIEKKIRFNENLGLGAKYTSGEEALFIHDCVKNGLKVKYFPIPIVEHPKESSGKTYSRENAIAKGIVFAKLFPFSFLLFDGYFSLKWLPAYRKDFSYCKFLGLLLKGNWIALTKKI